jgi:phosphoribosylpyrophosphate synthetase
MVYFMLRDRTFADGFPNLFVPEADKIRGQHVAFLASFSSPAVIFEQLSIIYALPRMFVSSFTLVLPFFPTGTLERMEDEGDIATASSLARMLSNIPISRGGPTSLVIFDIHALQVSALTYLMLDLQDIIFSQAVHKASMVVSIVSRVRPSGWGSRYCHFRDIHQYLDSRAMHGFTNYVHRPG